MKNPRSSFTVPIIILLTVGILGLISSFLVMGGSAATWFDGLRDGQSVACGVHVNAPVFGENLVITTPPTCHAEGSCFVSPLKSFSIASLKGDIGLWQSGVLYGTEPVDQSRFATAKTYTINACIPSEASAVRIGIITETGGIVNDQPISIT
jgi:hypothetical protein